MDSTFVLLWVLCAVTGAIISNGKNRGALDGFMWGAVLGIIGVIIVICEKPGAPKGMYTATCARCNTVQNVPQGQAEYTCWQCKASQHVTKGVLS